MSEEKEKIVSEEEASQVDPFQTAINRFNKGLFVEDYKPDNLKQLLLDVHASGFPSSGQRIAPEMVFDRLTVLTGQVEMEATQRNDAATAQYFARVGAGYKSALEMYNQVIEMYRSAMINAPMNFPQPSSMRSLKRK